MKLRTNAVAADCGGDKNFSARLTRTLLFGTSLLALLSLTACHRDMRDQHKYRGFRESSFFADGRSVRPAVPGTIPVGYLRSDTLFYTGKIAGKPADMFPFTIDKTVLERGRNRFNIYCSPCHDFTGSGNGMIVQRGHKVPPSFHIQRLREAPAGYFFDVITNGFGNMYDYSYQIRPEDRWAVVAWVRTLQTAGRGSLSNVPPAERAGLDQAAGAPSGQGAAGERKVTGH
ncbi:MAG: cytochrome c [Candidatus Eisenbacteria bacterium]|nr:cytochrome c [Candidatus Eisenbacteria bacterium]